MGHLAHHMDFTLVTAHLAFTHDLQDDFVLCGMAVPCGESGGQHPGVFLVKMFLGVVYQRLPRRQEAWVICIDHSAQQVNKRFVRIVHGRYIEGQGFVPMQGIASSCVHGRYLSGMPGSIGNHGHDSLDVSHSSFNLGDYTPEMDELLHGVADFCSLRDRDAMDIALVALACQAAQGQVRSVRFVQLVGERDDLRCRVTVEQVPGKGVQIAPHRVSDWHQFSALEAVPHRLQAFRDGRPATAHGTSCWNVYPLESAPHVMRMLELESDQELSPVCRSRLEALVRIYRSQESLLDYGERDTLTELLNRKTFDGAFQKVSSERSAAMDASLQDRRHVHAQEQYWLAVVDIDHFKKVNDNFGHLIGDEVLLLLARAMRASFRYHDQLYRFGGEEFVVLMRCANAMDAEAALERFRQAIEHHDFPQVGRITVSIGSSALQADDTPGGAFDRADKAVYFAKGNGRNQVCSYETLVARGLLAESIQESKEADFF